MSVVDFVRTLSLDEVKSYLENSNTDHRQSIICTAMMTTVICHKNDIYFFDVVLLYFKKISVYSANNLESLITQFVGLSITHLSKDAPEAWQQLTRKYSVEMKKLVSFKPVSIGSYKLRMSLPDDVGFDTDLGIHFQNGRFDLANGTFGPRAPPAINNPCTLISAVLPFDYVTNSAEDLNAMGTFLRRIYNSDEILRYVLYTLARSLRGDTSDCSCLLAVGRGGTGKTTVLELVEHVFAPLYATTLTSNVFNSQAVAYRVLSEVQPTSRFLIVSELDENKKDSSVIKCVCDGSITTTKLFKGGAHRIPINGKIFASSNFAPDFTSNDSGMDRRVRYVVHSHRFVDDETLVDNVSVFKKNPMPTLSDLDKCAFFNMLALHATDAYASVPQNTIPPVGVWSGEELVSIQAFLGTYFKSEVGGIVSKDTVLALAKAYYTNIEVPPALVIDRIVRMPAVVPVLYEPKRKHDGGTGVFVNIVQLVA